MMSRSLKVELTGEAQCVIHHAKFGINHIYDVSENPNVKIFDKPRHLTDQKNVNYLH